METTAAQGHIPVLPEETVSCAMPQTSGAFRVIDGTVGYGGHSSLILKKNPDAELLGIDRDETALANAAERLSFAGSRVRLTHGRFSTLAEKAAGAGWEKVDSILLDIGVSSPQIDTPERGFSFRFEAPLDMRMDRSRGITAADVVNTYSVQELTRIFRDYGELREARRLAEAIVRQREIKALTMCGELAELCEKVLRVPGGKRRTGPPAPTLPFQAIRIEVNGELDELRTALESAVDLLNEGGRLSVISFHSLEDRIVKQFFRDMAVKCKCPPGCPVCICNWQPKLEILTTKPLTASEKELAENPRSACAKLRCAVRINA